MLIDCFSCFDFISRDSTPSRPKFSSDKWIEYARTAFSVDPRIALSLASRFSTNTSLKAEVTNLVQVCFMLDGYYKGRLF